MFALFVLALPLFLVLAVVALTFGFVASVLGFVISLPFRILGLVFRLLGFVIAVPFLLLLGGIGVTAVVLTALIGGAVLLLPLLPFLLLVLGVLWLFKRHGKSAVHA